MLSVSGGELQTGASYIRWGRKTCGNNATLVYAGNIHQNIDIILYFSLESLFVLILALCY